MILTALVIATTALNPAAAEDEEALQLTELTAQAGIVEEDAIEEGELLFGEEEIAGPVDAE